MYTWSNRYDLCIHRIQYSMYQVYDICVYDICVTNEWTCDPDLSQTFDLCNHIAKWPRLITCTYICMKWFKFFPKSIKSQSISHTHYKSCSSVVFNILSSFFFFESQRDEIKLVYANISVIKVIHFYKHVLIHVQVRYI